MTDQQLWNQTIEGNELAFAQVVVKYQPLLFAFILGKTNDFYLSEDIAQEVWMNTYQKKDQVQNIRAYLFQAARNRIIDHYRKKSHQKTEEYSESSSQVIASEDETDLAQEENLAQVKSLLKDDDYKIYSLLSEGFNNAETAARLAIREKTVANRKTMIKKILAEKWKQNGTKR